MVRYDIKCPVCGTINRGLDLEETDGWMECDKCGTLAQQRGIHSAVMISALHSREDYYKSQKADHQAAAG